MFSATTHRNPDPDTAMTNTVTRIVSSINELTLEELIAKNFYTSENINKLIETQADEVILALFYKCKDVMTFESVYNNEYAVFEPQLIKDYEPELFTPTIFALIAKKAKNETCIAITHAIRKKTIALSLHFSTHLDTQYTSLLAYVAKYGSAQRFQTLFKQIADNEELNNWLMLYDEKLKKTNFDLLVALLDSASVLILLDKMEYRTLAFIILKHLHFHHKNELAPKLTLKNKNNENIYGKIFGELTIKAFTQYSFHGIDENAELLCKSISLKNFIIHYISSSDDIDYQLNTFNRCLNPKSNLYKFFDIQTGLTEPAEDKGSFKKIRNHITELRIFKLLEELCDKTKKNDSKLVGKNLNEIKKLAAKNPSSHLSTYLDLINAIVKFELATDKSQHEIKLNYKTLTELNTIKLDDKHHLTLIVLNHFPAFYEHLIQQSERSEKSVAPSTFTFSLRYLFFGKSATQKVKAYEIEFYSRPLYNV